MRIGKRVSEYEYSKQMLPQNRKEVFWDVVKIRWKKLVLLGLVMLVFTLPLYYLLWLGDSQLLYLEQNGSALTAEQLQEKYYALAMSRNIQNAVSVVAWAVFGIGLAGLIRVVRQYAWEENVNLLTGFLKGVRDNGKHTVLLCVVVGIVCAICSSTYNMVPYGSEYLGWVVLFQIGVAVAVVLPVCAIWLSMIPVYKNNVKQYLLFSFAVYLKSLLKTIGVFLGCAVLIVPVLLPFPFFHVVGAIAISMLLPFVLLIWTLYSYALFDQYINPRYYPELVGKGILGADSASPKEE